MAEERSSYSIRMPRTLLDALKAEADKRSHSMNAEIVQRLEASLQPNAVAEFSKLPEPMREAVFRAFVEIMNGIMETPEALQNLHIEDKK